MTDWHDLGDFGTFAKPRFPAVFIRNSSGAAVYDVLIDYRAPIDGALFGVGLGPVPPGETRVREIDYGGRLEADWEPDGARRNSPVVLIESPHPGRMSL